MSWSQVLFRWRLFHFIWSYLLFNIQKRISSDDHKLLPLTGFSFTSSGCPTGIISPCRRWRTPPVRARFLESTTALCAVQKASKELALERSSLDNVIGDSSAFTWAEFLSRLMCSAFDIYSRWNRSNETGHFRWDSFWLRWVHINFFQKFAQQSSFFPQFSGFISIIIGQLWRRSSVPYCHLKGDKEKYEGICYHLSWIYFVMVSRNTAIKLNFPGN